METRENHSLSSLEFLGRAALIAAAVYAFNTGLKMYRGSGIWAPSIPLGFLLYTTAVALLIAAFVSRRPNTKRTQMWVAVVLLGAIASSVAFEIEVGNLSYGTDAIAFAHTSGELVLEGQNPYDVEGRSVEDVIDRFGVPEISVTRLTSGGSVDRLVSYPSGHVLFFTGAIAIGVDDLRWAVLLVEIVGLGVIWWVLSPVGRLFVPFALLLESNLPVFFTSGGVTDWLWVVPLVFTAVYMHRGRLGYAGLALGIACAMKQQPWFLVPLALIWMYKKLASQGDRARREGMAAFVGGSVAGFIILNIPFILWSPTAWMSGILHPALGGLVPDGQGFSVLTSRGILPIPGEFYTVVLGLLLVLALWAYFRWFSRLQDLLWVVPPALFLVGHRSFHSYIIYWLPLALLWLDLRVNQLDDQPWDPDGQTETSARGTSLFGSWAIPLLALLVGLSVTVLMVPSAGAIEVGSVTPNVEGGVITSLSVKLTNPSDTDMRPVFELYWDGSPVPWYARDRRTLAAQETSTYEIVPARAEVLPPTRLVRGGLREVVDFRVRVNDAGNSTYSASEIVSMPLEVSVVNPFLDHWKRKTSVVAAPYGWSVATYGGSDDSRQVESRESGQGVVLNARSDGGGQTGWIETALIQEVAFFAPCYEWHLQGSAEYARDIGESPLLVSGFQVVQNDRAVWFVSSSDDTQRVSNLADGTRVVEVGADPDAATIVTLVLAGHAEEVGIDLGEGGVIKLFSAVHESIVGESRLEVTKLDGVNCS